MQSLFIISFMVLYCRVSAAVLLIINKHSSLCRAPPPTFSLFCFTYFLYSFLLTLTKRRKGHRFSGEQRHKGIGTEKKRMKKEKKTHLLYSTYLSTQRWRSGYACYLSNAKLQFLVLQHGRNRWMSSVSGCQIAIVYGSQISK